MLNRASMFDDQPLRDLRATGLNALCAAAGAQNADADGIGAKIKGRPQSANGPKIAYQYLSLGQCPKRG